MCGRTADRIMKRPALTVPRPISSRLKKTVLKKAFLQDFLLRVYESSSAFIYKTDRWNKVFFLPHCSSQTKAARRSRAPAQSLLFFLVFSCVFSFLWKLSSGHGSSRGPANSHSESVFDWCHNVRIGLSTLTFESRRRAFSRGATSPSFISK